MEIPFQEIIDVFSDNTNTTNDEHRMGYNTCLKEILKFVGCDEKKNLKIKSELLQSLSRYFLGATLTNGSDDVKQETETELQTMSRDEISQDGDRRVSDSTESIKYLNHTTRDKAIYEHGIQQVDCSATCWVISMSEHRRDSSPSLAPFVSFPIAIPNMSCSLQADVAHSTDPLPTDDTRDNCAHGTRVVPDRQGLVFVENVWSNTKSGRTDSYNNRNISPDSVTFCKSPWRPW